MFEFLFVAIIVCFILVYPISLLIIIPLFIAIFVIASKIETPTNKQTNTYTKKKDSRNWPDYIAYRAGRQFTSAMRRSTRRR